MRTEEQQDDRSRRLDLIITEPAETDLAQIDDYLCDTAGRVTTEGVQARIQGSLQLVCLMPQLGRRRDELIENLRSLVVDGYVIYYTADRETVSVLRVIRGSRDHSAFFAR